MKHITLRVSLWKKNINKTSRLYYFHNKYPWNHKKLQKKCYTKCGQNILTLFLIASGLLQKSFVVYSHVFFNIKNQKISFISKRKTKWQVGNYVTFFYTSFIRELVLSKSTRNNGDNESIFANQILVNL